MVHCANITPKVPSCLQEPLFRMFDKLPLLCNMRMAENSFIGM